MDREQHIDAQIQKDKYIHMDREQRIEAWIQRGRQTERTSRIFEPRQIKIDRLIDRDR